METEQKQSNLAAATQPAEPLYLENTLIRVLGVLFCHDPKSARKRTGTIAVNRGVKEKNVAVRLDAEYGQPGPFAHKVAMAIIRKQSGFGRPAQQQISFSQRELVRLTGRTSWGGRQSEQLVLALKQIRYTHILAHFKTADRFVEHDFSVFNEVLLERRTSHTDPIVACTIVLANPIIQSLNDRHFTCLNHTLMQQLGTINQAMYMRLFFHFSTQFDGHYRDRITFRKRYDDICVEWLGGLKVLKHKSKIIDEQLGVHLDQLVKAGFLTSYNIAPAERRDGFVLSFRPGATFFSDYQRFYANRAQGEIQFKFHEESQSIGEPHQVAYLFAEKRTGQKRDSVPYVSSKDVATAKELLAHIPMTDVSDFLDYAISEAAKTRFDLQTLGGVKQYLNGYLESRQRRTTALAAEAARQDEEREAKLQFEYVCFRRAEADKLFKTLPAEEQGTIEALARAITAPKGSHNTYMVETMLKLKRTQITVERHTDRLTSFDQWRTQRSF
ncbi:MAG: replication initiator protein A [Afipia sp.]|nr:replication initiator protein A [Afipia sp.]